MPEKKYFSLKFPKVIKIGPGMVYKLEVTFRPIIYEDYDDEIEINVVNGGSFKVPIAARIAKMAVEVTKSINFPETPVNETNTLDLVIKNIGQLDAPFEFDYKSPFDFSPSEGVVNANDSVIIKVSFSPITADFIKGKALCVIDKGKQISPSLLEGFGRYPFLKMSTTKLDFGEHFVYL